MKKTGMLLHPREFMKQLAVSILELKNYVEVMQKKQLVRLSGKLLHNRDLTKALWIMKLTGLLLIIGCLHVSANGFSQDTKVTVKFENTSLNKLFLALEKQTNYRFVYSNDRMTSEVRVNIKVEKEPLSLVLRRVLFNTGLTYRVLENLIVIMPFRTATNIIVRGKVTNQLGEPLASATIRIKGKNVGTASDQNGEFVLTNVDREATLLISSIGYEVQEVKLDGRTTIAVELKVQASSLGDVLVTGSTGYQAISKERSTGSFNIIGKEQLERPSINIAQRLIGTTAGVQARLDVDGNPTFEIRGQTTLYGAAQPLVVVDGFAIQGDFATINPTDVESITILKDAAAASIWGARSANGVIVITTKTAKKGVPLKVEFSAFTRMGQKFDLGYVNPLASSAETVAYEMKAFNRWGALINSGSLASNYGLQWSSATIALSEYSLGFITAAERDVILNRLNGQDNRQQIKDKLLANPVNQQYNLTLYGSSSKMSNALSLLYEANQSNYKETSNKKYMANYRTSASIFKWLDFQLSAMLLYNKFTTNGVTLNDIQSWSPYEMLQNADGSYTNLHQYYWPILERFVPMNKFPYADWTYNPLREIKNRDITSSQLNTRILAGLSVKLIKGLSVDSKIQYELFNMNNRNLYNEETYFVRNTVNVATTWDQATNKFTPNLPKGSILQQNRQKTETYNLRNQVNFNRIFQRKHEVNFIAGSELVNMVTETFGHPTTYGYNDETLTLGTFPNGPGGVFFPIRNWMGNNQTFAYVNTFSYRTERYFSMFGNAAYTYDGKYTISGSYRTDASNMITDDPQYRYAPFWSVGLGWQLYRERFMRGIEWVDRLNLRATYGYNGNVDRTTSFKPLINTLATPNTYSNDFTATIASFGNPTLRWEKTGTWNLGIDYSLFRGKLYGKVDLYNKSGRDLIATLSIPAVNGTTSQKLNNAEMINRGVELEVGSSVRIKGNDIVWSGNLNFSYNQNKITRLFVANYPAYNLIIGGTSAYVEGANASSLWAFDYAGIDNTQPVVKGVGKDKYNFSTWTPGDGRDFLLNMGTTVAPYTAGLMSSLKLYDFNVSFIITGKFGHVFRRQSFNYPVTWGDRVLPNKKVGEVMNGDPSKIIPLPLNDNEPQYYFWDRFYPYINYLTESASHIRMQELALTYSLQRNLLRKLHLSRLQFFAQGNDLFTIMANNADEDPEYPLGSMNPQPKLTLGMKLEF